MVFEVADCGGSCPKRLSCRLQKTCICPFDQDTFPRSSSESWENSQSKCSNKLMPCAFSRTGRTKLWQSVLAWFLSSSRFAILFCNQGTVRSKCRSVVSLWACEGIHFKEPALWPFFVAFFSFQIEGIAWYRRISWIPTSVDHANGCLLPRHCHLCRRVEKRSGLVTKTSMSQGRDPPIHQFLSTSFVVRLLRLSEEAFFIDGNIYTYIEFQGFPRHNVSCEKVHS